MSEVDKLRKQIESLERENKILRKHYENKKENLINLSFSGVKQVFDSLDAIVYIADIQNYELLYLNKKGKEIFREFKDKICWQVMQKGLKKPCNFCINKNSDNKSLLQREFLNPFDNKWYKSFDIFIEWGKNRKVKLEIALDITDVKKAEFLRIKNDEELKKSEKKYKALFSTLPYPAIVHGSEKLILEINDSAAKFANIKNKNEIIGLPLEGFIGTDGKKETLRRANKFLHSDKNTLNVIEEKFITINGEVKDVEVAGTKFIDIDGKTKILVVFNDITERKNTEKKLKELIATKDKFFSIIAHDLKNPFHQILGFSDILSENIDNYEKQQIKKIVQYLISSANNGYKLLENLLDWSRSQTGNIKFIPGKLNISKIIRSELNFFKNNAKQKDIQLVFDIKNPNVFVYADKDMMKTILRNLISNALKYTFPGGSINLIVIKKEQFVIVSVQDSGIGIPKDKLKNLFKIDKTNSTPGTNNEQGTGLGLILCKEFINKNGGDIFIDSEAGIGSKFSFTVPAS